MGLRSHSRLNEVIRVGSYSDRTGGLKGREQYMYVQASQKGRMRAGGLPQARKRTLTEPNRTGTPTPDF